MQSKLVSIIIPVYNADKYIVKCINSALNQTYSNIEVIVVNDGSTDSTERLLNEIKDPRLIIINQDNKGCSSAKNVGLRISKGEFIQYLDADDILSLDKIEFQVGALVNELNTVAVCKTLIFEDEIDEIAGEIDTDFIKKEGSGLEFLLRLLGSEGTSGMVQPNAFLITRQISNQIGEWNEKISPSPDEDGEYFARVLCCADKVRYTEGINYYRKNTHQSSLSKLYSYQRVLNLLETVELKFQHIFQINKSNLSKELYQLNISQVVYQFGLQYPKIISIAALKLKQREILKFKIANNKKFNISVIFFGIRITLAILGGYRGFKKIINIH